MTSAAANAIRSIDRIEETGADTGVSEFVGALFFDIGFLLSLTVVILDQRTCAWC
jgi:hypothetical protein